MIKIFSKFKISPVYFWVTSLSVLFLLTSTLVAWKTYVLLFEPEKIVWDLRDRFSSCVHWPATQPGPYFEREGNFDLTMLDDHGLVMFHERAYHLNVVRKKNDVIQILIIQFGQWYDAEQSYLTAKKVMTRLRFEPASFTELDDWHNAVRARVPYAQFCVAHGSVPVDYPGYVKHSLGKEFRITPILGDPSTGNTRFALTLNLSSG